MVRLGGTDVDPYDDAGHGGRNAAGPPEERPAPEAPGRSRCDQLEFLISSR